MKRWSILIALAVATATGNSTGTGIPSGNPTGTGNLADMAQAAAAIAAANADGIRALKAHDADRIAAPYAVNAVFVLGSGRVIAGRAAIADAMRARFKAVNVVGGTIHQLSLKQADGVTIEWGEAGITTETPDGQMHTSRALYLTVWKKSASGPWEILRNLTF